MMKDVVFISQYLNWSGSGNTVSYKSSINIRSRILGKLVWGFILMLPVAAWGADWYMDSAVGLAEEYNNNPRLSLDPEKSVWGQRLNLDMSIAAEMPLSGFSLQPQLIVSRYPGAQDLDNEVKKMTLETHRQRERVVSAISIDWLRDTTLTSELEDTGFIQTTKNRTVRSVHPSFGYSWTERLNMNFHWDYTDVVYQDALMTGLTDYTHQSLGSAVVYKWNSEDRLQAELYGSRLNAPKVKNQVTDLGVRATYSHALYEYTQASFTLGVHRVKSELGLVGIGYESVKNGFLGDMSLSQQREKSSWNISLQQTIDPSGSGLLVQNNRFAVDVSRHFSRYWYGTLSSLYMQNNDLQSQSVFDSRRYGRLSAGTSWQPVPNWKLSMRYGYQWQKYESSSRAAVSHQVVANVSYDMDKKRIYP